MKVSLISGTLAIQKFQPWQLTGRVYERVSQRCAQPEPTLGIAGTRDLAQGGERPLAGLSATLSTSNTLPCCPAPHHTHAHSSALVQPLLVSLTWIPDALQARNEVAVVSIFSITLDPQEKHRAVHLMEKGRPSNTIPANPALLYTG